jgi:hypothetical protein
MDFQKIVQLLAMRILIIGLANEDYQTIRYQIQTQTIGLLSCQILKKPISCPALTIIMIIKIVLQMQLSIINNNRKNSYYIKVIFSCH